MRGSKKIVANILAATLLASSASAFAATKDATPYDESIKILSALGIMSGDGDGNYRPNDTIIRSEVTRMVIHALGLEDAAKSSQGISKFPDVPVDHWANGYINIATSQKIVVGDDTGKFRPNDKITYAEAMTILVRALGYEKVAEMKGGFPHGYIVVGSDNKISTGVFSSAYKHISRGEVARMTENALNAKIMEVTGYGDDLKHEITDKTLLKDKLNVIKSQGQIVAIPNTSLEGASNLSQGEVKIGNKVYDTDQNLNNLLGYNVVFYVTETDKSDNTIILALPEENKNSSIEIKADLFEKISEKNGEKVLEFFKTESDKKLSNATLETDAKLIYNGKYEAMSDELLNMKNKSGKVVLLDTDRSGKYDIAFVTEYSNMVVEEVTASGKIIDKYSAPAIKLDEEDEDISFTITRGYEELKPSDLKEFDVLSVAKSKDSKIFSIVVSNETVDGKVTGVSSEGVYIDGKLYKIADNYTAQIGLGTEGKFYLDIDNKIAATDKLSQISDSYAYLVKAYADMNADEVAKFKVFTKDGAEKLFVATEKIKYNGVRGKLATDVVDEFNKEGSTKKQLITYTLNSEGQIIAIDTAKDNSQTGAIDENNFTMNHILDDAKFNGALNMLGNVKLDDKTIIFDIPESATDISDYSIASLSMFEDGQKYDAIVFDKTEDFYAKVIIVTNAAFQTNADSSIAIVEKVVSATNDEDEETEMLYAYQDGKQIKINAEESGILEKSEGVSLKNGDIIQYQKNSKGEIASIRVLFDVDQKTTEKAQTPVENLSILYGKVEKKFQNSMNITIDGGEVINLQLPENVTVYELDTTREKNNIEVATTGDIIPFDEDEGNRVFVRIYKDVVQEVVVVR